MCRFKKILSFSVKESRIRVNSCRVALHAGGQVLDVAVVLILVADLVVEQVHVRGPS